MHVASQAWKLEQERLKEEEMTKKSKKDSPPKGKQEKEGSKSMDNKKSKTPSGKKRPETAGNTDRTATESVVTTAPPMEEKKELHLTEKPFNVRAQTKKNIDIS